MKRTIILSLLLTTISWGIISTEVTKVSFACDGTETTFACTSSNKIICFDDDDFDVYLRLTSTGVETEQTKTTHYTVSAVNNDYTSGFTVEMVTAPAATYTLHVKRDLAVTHDLNLVRGRNVPREATERNFDRMVLLIQDLQEKVDRSLRIPITDTGMDTELGSSVDRASTYLGFSADGSPILTAGTSSALVASVFGESLIDDADAAAARTTLEIDADDMVTFGIARVDDLKTKSPWIDVTHPDYGAIPDDGIDDTAAIQAALTAGKAAETEVYFPSGTYRVTILTLADASNMKIRGNGIGQSIIVTTATLKDEVANKFAILYLDTPTDFIIEGLEFQGTEIAYVNDGLTTRCIKADSVTGLVVKDCKFTKTELGIHCDATGTRGIVERCIATSCYYNGIRIEGTSTADRSTYMIVRDNICYDNDGGLGRGSGIHTKFCDYSTVVNNSCYGNGASGIRIQRTGFSVVDGNVCRDNGTSGINLYNNSDNNIVTGNICISNATARHGDVDITLAAGETYTAAKGNAGTGMSGISVENVGNNNMIIGNMCANETGSYQGYGIAANLRNFPNATTSSEKCIIAFNTAYGNIHGQIEDRSQTNLTGFNIASESGAGIAMTSDFTHYATPPVLKYTAKPAAGNWRAGARIWDNNIAASADPGWVTTTTGTFGALAGVTATTTDTTSTLLPNVLTGLATGQYLTVAGGSDYSGARVLKVPAALGSTTVDVESASGQTTLNVAATTDFAVGDTVLIDRAGTPEEAIITVITAGASFTLQANLANTHAAAVTVEAVVIMDSEESSEVAGQAVSFTAPVLSEMPDLD